MPEAPPAELPVPCATDSILFEAWQCVRDGEETKWVKVYVPATDVGSARVGSAPCAGGCAKSEAIKTAREMKWSAEELVKVLKAIG